MKDGYRCTKLDRGRKRERLIVDILNCLKTRKIILCIEYILLWKTCVVHPPSNGSSLIPCMVAILNPHPLLPLVLRSTQKHWSAHPFPPKLLSAYQLPRLEPENQHQTALIWRPHSLLSWFIVGRDMSISCKRFTVQFRHVFQHPEPWHFPCTAPFSQPPGCFPQIGILVNRWVVGLGRGMGRGRV